MAGPTTFNGTQSAVGFVGLFHFDKRRFEERPRWRGACVAGASWHALALQAPVPTRGGHRASAVPAGRGPGAEPLASMMGAEEGAEGAIFGSAKIVTEATDDADIALALRERPPA